MRKNIDIVNQSSMAGDALPPEDDVLEAIHAVMHLARGQRHRAVRDAEPGLSPMEGRVLAYFAHHPGATLSDLAAHAERDKGQMARLVAGLRERGLLQAAVDENDRRITRLHLAGAAQAQHQAMARLRRTLSQRAAAGLSVSERKQLMALLRKVQAALAAPGA